MPSKRVEILFNNFPSDYPVNLRRDYLRILNKLMRLWDTTRFDVYMRELMLSMRDHRNGFTPPVVDEILFINRLHEECVRQGIKLPSEVNWHELPIKCHSAEMFDSIIRNAPYDDICLCFDQNISVDYRFMNGSTPLIAAAEVGRLDVIEYLFDSGADIDACTDLNSCALHMAAYHGHFAVVEFLLKNGANPNIRDSAGSTPLFLSISRGHRLIAAELIVAGAHIDKEKMVNMALLKGMTEIALILKMRPA